VDVCPEQCLELVPLEQLEFPEPVLAHLEQNSSAYEVELRGVTTQELSAGTLTGSVMLKDETRCIRCGLCALRCPVREITMEAFHFKSAEGTGLISIQSFDLRSNR
jgi:NAD-dependent dihydropyrimidine dehydrogenase PreA subunit